MTPHSDDDRAYLLTPPVPAALAVVRLTGPGVCPFLARRFSSPVRVERAVHGRLRDEHGQTLDDPVVVLCDADEADLTLHGGPWVVRSVLDLARRDGFAVVPADGRPPATDAVGWLDEDVMRHLPGAPTSATVRMLLAQPDAWRGLRGRSDVAEWRTVLAESSGHWLTAPPTVAIVGPPNVGKSTLANQLFGQQRSITADGPGTTRDWVGELADLDGLAVMLVDTPGIRATTDAIEAVAIEGGRARASTADLTLLVLDRSIPLDAAARSMLAAHPNAPRIANKADRPPAWSIEAIATTASTGNGLDAVRSAIRKWFGCEVIDPNRPRWWTERQRTFLQRGIEAMEAG